MRRTWVWITFAAIVVLMDEWIKTVALAHLADSVHKNSGILFNFPLPMPLIIPLTIALGAILWFQTSQRMASLFIILGGAGNLYDRLAYGYTVDYLFLPWGLAFNLSDIIIVVGIILFLLGTRSSTDAIDDTAKQ